MVRASLNLSARVIKSSIGYCERFRRPERHVSSQVQHYLPRRAKFLGSVAFILSYQLKLTKMRAELANLNHCAVSFLSRATANLYWYYM